MNLPVNVRENLVIGKFCAHDKSSNLLLQMVACDKPGTNPCGEGGSYTGVLSSFSESCVDGSIEIRTTFSMSNELILYAAPITPDILRSAIRWVKKGEVENNDNQSHQLDVLFTEYVNALTQANIPNGTWEVLSEFIRDREWTGKLWGGEPVKFLSSVLTSGADENEKARLLRRYLVSNVCWQTKVAVFPTDSLHRFATLDMVVNDQVPENVPEEIKSKFHQFVKGLPVRECEGERIITSEILDPVLAINLVAPAIIDNDFLLSMKCSSASSQRFHASSTPHNAMNLLAIGLDQVVKNVFNGTDLYHLWVDENQTHGLLRVLQNLDRDTRDLKSDFIQILTGDGLLQDRVTTDTLDEFFDLGQPFNNQLRRFSDIYIHYWIIAMTTKFHAQLKEFVSHAPGLSNVVLGINLQKVSEMDLDSLLSMFPMKKLVKSESMVYSLEVVKATLELLLPEKETKTDPINGNVYENKECTAQENDFIRTLFFACLSKESFSSIANFASCRVPSSSVVEQQGPPSVEDASRTVRICLLIVSTISDFSHQLWRGGYFDSKTHKGSQCNKMSVESSYAMVLLSAIKHTYEYALMMGVNPVLGQDRPFTDQEAAEVRVVTDPNKWRFGERALKDPIIMFALDFFCQMMKHNRGAPEDKKKSEYKTYAAEMLDRSIRFDIPLDNLTVVNPDSDKTRIWLGQLSKGEKANLSMEINLSNANLAGVDLKPKVSLVEVIGNGEDPKYSTHRPCQHWKNFTSCKHLWNHLKQIKPSEDAAKSNANHDRTKNPVALPAPGDVQRKGVEELGERVRDEAVPAPQKNNTNENSIVEEGGSEPNSVPDNEDGLSTNNAKDNKESKIDAPTKPKPKVARLSVNKIFKTNILAVGKGIIGNLTTYPETVEELRPDQVNALAQGALEMLKCHSKLEHVKQQGKQRRLSATEQNGKNPYILDQAACNDRDGTIDLDENPRNSNDYERTSADDEELSQGYDPNWRAAYGKEEYLPDISNFHIDVTDPFIFEFTLKKQMNKMGR